MFMIHLVLEIVCSNLCVLFCLCVVGCCSCLGGLRGGGESCFSLFCVLYLWLASLFLRHFLNVSKVFCDDGLYWVLLFPLVCVILAFFKVSLSLRIRNFIHKITNLSAVCDYELIAFLSFSWQQVQWHLLVFKVMWKWKLNEEEKLPLKKIQAIINLTFRMLGGDFNLWREVLDVNTRYGFFEI